MQISLETWPDELSLYFRRDMVLNDIILKQPTIGDILDFGESRYFSMAKSLVTIPSDIKPELQDIGIDYEKISDFELFCMLTANLRKEDTYLLLGNTDLGKYKLCLNNENGEKVLYNEETNSVIDRRIHMFLTKYICKLHGFKQKVEHAANQFTKKILIEDDRARKQLAKNKPYESYLLPKISSLINHPGFKYDSSSILNIGIYELRDSIERISAIQTAQALLHGAYSGMIDVSKIKQKELDWTRKL